MLAGRDEQRLAAAGKALNYQVRTLPYDATALDTHQALIDRAFAAGDVGLVISAAGILTPQETLERDPLQAGLLIETNFTGHVTTLLAAAARMRAQGYGTIVVLSSVAAIRPRKANFVYGAAKAGLDAFARGLGARPASAVGQGWPRWPPCSGCCPGPSGADYPAEPGGFADAGAGGRGRPGPA